METVETTTEKAPLEVKDLPTGEKPTKAKKERKTKAKEQSQSVEPKSVTFPVEGTVNAYGFIHLSNGVAEAFGAARGKKTPITIDLKDGNLIISKA